MRFILTHIILLGCLATPALLAQPFKMQGRQPMERVEALKKVRLIEVLNLNEEQSVRFFARLQEHQSSRQELGKEREEAFERLNRLVRNNADGSDLDKIFPEIQAINLKVAQADEAFFNKLGDILSANQRGKYLLFERQFEKELREAMREVHRRRNRRE